MCHQNKLALVCLRPDTFLYPNFCKQACCYQSKRCKKESSHYSKAFGLWKIANIQSQMNKKKIQKTVEGAPIAQLHLKSTPLVSSDLGQTPTGSVLGHQSQHYALKLNNSESVTCGNTTFPKDAKVKLPPWYNCLKSNPVNSIEIKQSTRGQHNKTNWYRYRVEGITASQMHHVVLRKKKTNRCSTKISFFHKYIYMCSNRIWHNTREISKSTKYCWKVNQQHPSSWLWSHYQQGISISGCNTRC